MRRRYDTAAIAGVGLVVALLIVNAGIAYRNTVQLSNDTRWVAHTNSILDSISELQGTIVDAETGQRGFIITGRESFLEPYTNAVAKEQSGTTRIESQIAELQSITAAEPRQQDRIQLLQPLIAQRLRILKDAIDLRRQNPAMAYALVASERGKKVMDEVRSIVTEMRLDEQQQLTARQERASSAFRVTVASELATTVLALLLFAVCIFLVDRNFRNQRRAAAEVHQERERLRVTLNSIGDGVIAADLGGRVTLVNRVAQNLTGWTQVAAVGKSVGEVFRIVDESSRKPIDNPISRTIFEGKPVGMSNPALLVSDEGTERPIADSCAPIRDAAGKAIGAVLVFRDVTDERAAQQSVRESDARKRAILDTALDCILTVDRDGKIIELNAACEQMLGCDRDRLLGRELAEAMIPEAGRVAYREMMAKFLAGSDSTMDRRTEIVGARCDGIEFPAELTVTRIETDRGPLLTAFVRDITERNYAEKRLADALRFANGIVDTVQMPLLVLNSDLNIKSANRSYYETFHTEPAQTISFPLAELGDRQWDDPELLALLRDVVTRDRGFMDFEIEHQFPRVGKRVMLLSALRIQHEGDHTDLILLAIEDVTTRKRSEETIVELLASEQRRAERLQQLAAASLTINSANSESSVFNVVQMEAVRIIGAQRAEVVFGGVNPPEMDASLVAPLIGRNGRTLGEIRLFDNGNSGFDHDDRAIATQLAHMTTVALDNVRLYEELRVTDRRKDEFLATLAHELRNPLAAIRNSLQLMRIAGDNPDIREESRGLLERQVKQLVRLVDDLMDISRITRGKLELRKEHIELADVIASAVETSRPLVDEMGHQLSVSQPDRPVQLNADLTRLAQVFLNLLNNSAKYSNPGGRIELTADVKNDQVTVRVRDTGIGMSEETLARIFDMFTQADRAGSRSQGGLGIGLALARQLVEMHGGSIAAHSEGLGRGSEFIVSLPIAAHPDSDQATPTASREELTQHVKRRVLVVDDNRDAADSLSTLIGMLGHEVHTAYDGFEAVEAASEFHPDVVLLDIGLPRISGYEAALRIRELPAGNKIFLVALTGWGQDEDRRRSREAGFDRHIVKPVNPDVLEPLLASAQRT